MIWQFLSWYLVVQLITLITLPLAMRLFVNLPDRGYAFVKSLGILLIGFVFWLGYSYGLLRNEQGGAWLTLILVTVASLAMGRRLWQRAERETTTGLNWRYILFVEVLFLFIFAFWAYVRAHDPSVDHTEEPMDLMFMNSIWVSPTFPPHDAWLSGYAISYYYFGYWLLTTIGRLANQPPEIAYTLGQANWYALLWIGCFGIVYNLVAKGYGQGARALFGGVLGALSVAFAGNPQGFLEWLHAKGFAITWIARWFDVSNFPAASGSSSGQSGNWYVSFDWWWWRASRIIGDRWLNGDHMEVIDEFPIFSYLLGDNHPHVTAMPFALLIIALALNFFLSKERIALPIDHARRDREADDVDTTGADPLPSSWLPPLLRSSAAMHSFLQSAFPMGGGGALIMAITLGSLLFLNTWDFPFYWLLLGLSLLVLVWRNLAVVTYLSYWRRWQQAFTISAITMIAAAVLSWLLYYPYLLTAQSQAGGIVPNLFNPTRLPQFLLFFGFAILGVLALLGLGWQRIKQLEARPHATQIPTSTVGVLALIVLGLPLFFLITSVLLAVNTPRGRQLLAGNMPLPAGAESYLPFILERWGANFGTFLLVGILIALTAWLIWRYLQQLAVDPTVDEPTNQVDLPNLFVLILALIGLLLVFAPEFVYLRDNFGTRMNTVFKFYYQAWLLFGLAASYVIVTVVGNVFGGRNVPANPAPHTGARWGTFACALLSLILVVSGLFYPVMAIYSKSGGFAREATFNSVAYLEQYGQAEWAAIDWVRTNTPGDAIVLESKGSSYDSTYNRMSTLTGRQTLMGWDGHESQWRGKAFGEMAQGRDQALETIYRGATPEQIAETLNQWQIDYVYVGPAERRRYEITPQGERNLARATDLAFELGDVRIYQRRQ